MQTLSQLQSGELITPLSIKLSENIETFPQEIFQFADTLEVLDLSGNRLSELPADFAKLKKLRIFFCSDNRFEHLPEVLSELPELDIVGFKANKISEVSGKAINKNLRWLILTDNHISKIPSEIGNCTRMQKLMLAGNRLTELPEALVNCTNLELLRIAANKIECFPNWLLTMPKLSWLAISGNPLAGNHTKVSDPLSTISWRNLTINHVLGSGASGIIYHATLISDSEPLKQVAVKVFKGEVTSDGLPDDELTACLTAGNHAGLVTLIGQLTGHPEKRKGLVMDLIAADFVNLGKPPSLKTCTRDIFDDCYSITGSQMIRIATTIATVADHLHGKKIMHGDLYAHNILVDKAGNTFLSDFGAASFYKDPLMEKLDVRAFGCLLEDLISICDDTVFNDQIQELITKCTLTKPARRPGFSELIMRLAEISKPY